MATEKRLIDANAMMGEVYDSDEKHGNDVWHTGDIEYLVMALPTVEAVEVVRCCDCVSCKVILDNVGSGHWHCKKRYGLPEVDPTDFCSGGERRTDNA